MSGLTKGVGGLALTLIPLWYMFIDLARIPNWTSDIATPGQVVAVVGFLLLLFFSIAAIMETVEEM